jgi:hypothetical protein
MQMAATPRFAPRFRIAESKATRMRALESAKRCAGGGQNDNIVHDKFTIQ